MTKTTELRRYTNIPSLISILTTKKLTLLDPQTWEDKNDTLTLEIYKDHKKLETLLALCFTEYSETYHHWKIYAGDSSGVCIVFNKEILIEHLELCEKTSYGPVTYKTLKEIKESNINIDEFPFLKRKAYSDEREFRVVHEHQTIKRDTHPIPISLKSIRRILFSHRLPNPLLKSLRATILNFEDCEHLEGNLYKTTITKSSDWKVAVKNAYDKIKYPNREREVLGHLEKPHPTGHLVKSFSPEPSTHPPR